ncbi:DUF3017 domain-containing protein [Rhodococcus coprophilus]|uniref:Protein of uncharacterized function (DUF3017) n=1 Tax=Rhodococcus coprophilus TaxID=38310 RepID=A0A2X4XMP4_9NOCA|nr:DUF3017 domain-containing protein [Rhodococcus coprophilus]MBM7460024.1 putative neutral ceramidase superfamily lipid hydrolase [Rhodococcus coprophilus]SQI37944.1 Protein of uncharacterised function (DUF3017) [Rhodococcus coprophilus]
MGRALRFARLNLPLIAVALVIALAVALVLADRWRRGAFVFGGATILAGLLRWVLDESRVGVLAVRSKGFDVGALLVVGGVIVALAASIDPLGTG